MRMSLCHTDRQYFAKGMCKLCYYADRNRKSRASHPEIWRDYSRKSREKNREKILESSRKWKRANPEKIKAYTENHPQVVNPAVREKYKIKNAARIKMVSALWAKRNSQKIKGYHHVRRAALRGELSENCNDKMEALNRERFCYWCRARMTKAKRNVFRATDRTVDHVKPISRGGLHVPGNLVACCSKCNFSKGKKLYWEWDASQGGDLAS